MEGRLRDFVAEYAAQGDHRTATDVDKASGERLASLMTQAAGAAGTVRLCSFPHRLCKPVAGSVSIAGRWTAHGVPMYDCKEYTGVEGISGTLGLAGSDCDIAICTYSDANAPDLWEARDSARHRAAIAVYVPKSADGQGLALINAQDFPSGGRGVPALQLHSKYLDALKTAAEEGATATVVAQMEETPGTAMNVEAEIPGSDPCAAPVLVLTPRSGWGACALERGASLGAFVEILRAVAAGKPRRPVVFAANTGHELSHTGFRHFNTTRPGFAKGAHLCMHLGASWASVELIATETAALLLQLSDADAEALALDTLSDHALPPERFRIVRGSARPVGEARELYDEGARYVSIIGHRCNKAFHMEEDCTVERVNFQILLQLTEACAQLVAKAAECHAASL